MHIGRLQPKASFTFKSGAVTLEDLGKMMSTSDDGKTISFNIPQDVIESSSTADSRHSADLSDPFGWNTKVDDASKAQEKPAIRPEVQQAIDFISNADDIRVIHTTRGLPPQYPAGFPAGRYAVGAKKGNETKTFIMNTEGVVSHLGEVIPGKTRVDGFVAEVADPYSRPADSAKFNDSELEALTVAMMKNKPEAPATQYAAAIYSNGDQVKYSKAYIQAVEI